MKCDQIGKQPVLRRAAGNHVHVVESVGCILQIGNLVAFFFFFFFCHVTFVAVWQQCTVVVAVSMSLQDPL